jgi:hypothetical protein
MYPLGMMKKLNDALNHEQNNTEQSSTVETDHLPERKKETLN